MNAPKKKPYSKVTQADFLRLARYVEKLPNPSSFHTLDHAAKELAKATGIKVTAKSLHTYIEKIPDVFGRIQTKRTASKEVCKCGEIQLELEAHVEVFKKFIEAYKDFQQRHENMHNKIDAQLRELDTKMTLIEEQLNELNLRLKKVESSTYDSAR